MSQQLARSQYRTHANHQRKARHAWASNFVIAHMQSCISSLGKLTRNLFASILTVCVIGIALALPTGLFVVLDNMQQLGNDWQQGSQISLFLKMDVTPEEAKQLVNKIKASDLSTKVEFISPEEGLKTLEKHSGFSDVLAELNENPLPSVIEVYPSKLNPTPQELAALEKRLKQFPEVDIAQLDMEWVQRLHSMIALAERIVFALAILFGIGVLLTVGNTIRLAIAHYKKELEIIQLFGATDAFIRRPFLYTGLFYGFLGGLIASILVTVFKFSLQGPVSNVMGLYNSSLTLNGLSFSSFLILLIFSSFL